MYWTNTDGNVRQCIGANMSNLTKSDLRDIRRRNLKLWFQDRQYPAKDSSYISQLVNAKVSSFGERVARRLERENGMPDFFLDQVDNNPELIKSIAKSQDDEHNHKINLLDVKAIAGTSGYVNPDYPDVITSIWLSDSGVLELLNRKHTRGINLINVPTDSMTPTINKGDVVFIDNTVDYYTGEGVYFFELDGECYIKRLQKIPSGIMRALSDNQLYSPFDITLEHFSNAKILGKFIKVLHITPQDL